MYTECKHINKTLRVRTISDGRTQIRWQCQDCGIAVGCAVQQAKAIELNHGPVVHKFDEEAHIKGKRLNKYEKRKQEYNEYLFTDKWKTIRKAVFVRDHYTCVFCHGEANHVHHIHYNNLYNEMNHLGDVVSICQYCHQLLHRFIDGFKNFLWSA